MARGYRLRRTDMDTHGHSYLRGDIGDAHYSRIGQSGVYSPPKALQLYAWVREVTGAEWRIEPVD